MAGKLAAVKRVGTVGLAALHTRMNELIADAERQLAAHDRIGTPAPLLRLARRSQDEKAYNRYLGWVLDPARNHRVAIAALTALADELGFDALSNDLGEPKRRVEISVRSERPWPEGVGSSKEPDLLVISPGALFLLENKVGSGESGDQYTPYRESLDVLADLHGIDRGDARAHLLAPEERAAPERWGRTLLHRELAQILATLAKERDLPFWDRVLCYELADAFSESDVASRLSSVRRLAHEARRGPVRPSGAHRLAELLPLPDPFEWRIEP